MLAKGAADVVKGDRIGAAIRKAHAEAEDAQIMPPAVVRLVRVGAGKVRARKKNDELFIFTHSASVNTFFLCVLCW